MKKILNFHSAIANFLGLLTLALMFAIVVDVCGRFLFNKPLQGGVEISQVLLAWILFLPLAYALVRKAHVRVTIILDHLPRRLNLIAEAFVAIISLGCFVLIIYASWKQFWESFSVGETMPAPIWIPAWLAKLAIPAGFLLFFFQLCVDLINTLKLLGKEGRTIDP